MLADGWCHHCFPSLVLWRLSFHSVWECVCVSECVSTCVRVVSSRCITVLKPVRRFDLPYSTNVKLKIFFCFVFLLTGYCHFLFPYRRREIHVGSINMELILRVFNYSSKHELNNTTRPGHPLHFRVRHHELHELLFISVLCKIAVCPASTVNEWIINKFRSAIYFLWWVFWLN